MTPFRIRTDLPGQVDLRDALWPVDNIGDVAAAAASAVVTALQYHCNRLDQAPTKLSTLFVHYNARTTMGVEGQNVGTTIEAAIRAAEMYGACREETWPFDAAKVLDRPSQRAYEEARQFAVVLGINPADAVEALSMRYPVPVVVRVPNRCIDEAGRTGQLPAPTPQDLQGAQINHALVLVAYDMATQTVTARNCWGAEWGTQGHCTISFDALNALIPPGMPRTWIIASLDAVNLQTGGQPVIGGAGRITAAADPAPVPAPAPAPAPPAQPERLADMAARLRAEIRGDVQRGMEDASQRIRDMMNRNNPPAPGPPAPAPPAIVPPANVAKDICPECNGSGKCMKCGGRGCGSCGYGNCYRCGGRGLV